MWSLDPVYPVQIHRRQESNPVYSGWTRVKHPDSIVYDTVGECASIKHKNVLDLPTRSERRTWKYVCWSIAFCFWCFMHYGQQLIHWVFCLKWPIQVFEAQSHGGPWWTFGLCSKSTLQPGLLPNSSQSTRAKPHWFWMGHVPAYSHTCDSKWYVLQSSHPLSLHSFMKTSHRQSRGLRYWQRQILYW